MRWPWQKRSAKHPHYGLIEHAFADAHGEIARLKQDRAEIEALGAVLDSQIRNLQRQLVEEKAKVRSLTAQLREARKKLAGNK